jgi:hypothetical protein
VISSVLHVVHALHSSGTAQIPLDGDHAPRTSTFEFRSLPPGSYSVTAMLMGPGSEPRATLQQQVNVMASGAGR